MANKAELTSKQCALSSRLRLLDSIVAPDVLHGSASWALSTPEQAKLQRTQRGMFRFVFGSGRRPTARPDGGASDDVSTEGESLSGSASDGEAESWMSWVRRATRAFERARGTDQVR